MQLQVARIGKPHGIRGEVTVQVLTDVPNDRFLPGTELAVEPPSLGPLTLRSARWNKDILLLGFEQITDRNQAEELRGAQLFVEADETEDDGDADAWYEHELVGLQARRQGSDGRIEVVGTVTGLRTLPVQDLLVIEDTAGAEVLVPFVAEIVPVVDVEQRYVLLTPPPGLFELNADEAGTGSETGDGADESGSPESGAVQPGAGSPKNEG